MLPGAHRQVHQRAAGWAVYWYAWRGGPQIARFAGATLEGAEAAEIAGAAELAKGYGSERSPRAPDGTVARAVHSWLTSAEFKQLAPATRQAWGPWLEKVRAKWGHLSGEEFSSDETAAQIRQWRDEIAACSPSSADKAVEAIGRFVRYARQRSVKLLPRDCDPTDELGQVYVAPPKIAPPRADALAAIAALPPLAGAICDIALNSGLRRSDLVRLCDTHVDETRGVIRIDTQKGKKQGRVAVIRLTPPLLGGIRRAQELRDARYAHICADRARPSRKGRTGPPARHLNVIVNTHAEPFTPDGLYQHVRTAFENVSKPRINPHGFRRAAATQRFLSGLSWAQIGRELGWGEGEAETMGAIYVPPEAVAEGA